VLGMAAAFGLNMGLNNFSLAFIPLSVNQVIRACGPLAVALLQLLFRQGRCGSRAEWLLMALGVACAVVTVVARAEGRLVSDSGYAFGALLCGVSVLCAALDYVFKQMTGEMKMSPVDAMGYMALPAFAILLLPGVLWQHQVPDAWAAQLAGTSLGRPSAGCWTDLAVLSRGCELRPAVLGLVAASGVLAFGYNTLTTFLTVRLSATTTSLIGNLPISTVISLLVLERRVPTGAWGVLLWAGIAGNVLAFALYSRGRQRRDRDLGGGP